MYYGKFKLQEESWEAYDRMYEASMNAPSFDDDKVYPNGYYRSFGEQGANNGFADKYASLQHTSSMSKIFDALHDRYASTSWN